MSDKDEFEFWGEPDSKDRQWDPPAEEEDFQGEQDLGPTTVKKGSRQTVLLLVLLLVLAGAGAYFYLGGQSEPEPPPVTQAKKPIALPPPPPPAKKEATVGTEPVSPPPTTSKPETAAVKEPPVAAKPESKPAEPAKATKPPVAVGQAAAPASPKDAVPATTVKASDSAPAKAAAPAPVKAAPEAVKAAVPAEKGAYFLQAGIFAVKSNLNAAEAKVRRLGYQPRVRTVQQKTAMTRLRVGGFFAAEGEAKLQSLKQTVPEAFLLRQGEYALVYAGSYKDPAQARLAAESLRQKGIRIDEETVEVETPLHVLTFGEFADRKGAAEAAARAKANGLQTIIGKND